MNVVRERILIDTEETIKKYPISSHRDLVAFTVGACYFLDIDDDDEAADFCEVIAIVDKDWLFDYMDVENPRQYLLEEYVWDESIDWFDEANRTGHLCMIAFN